MGVQIVDSPTDLIGTVDAVFIESNEGGVHLGHAKPFLEAGLPLFIDKPYAATTAQARAIADLAAQHGVPIFSASSLRYTETVKEVQASLADEGGAVGAFVHSPGSEHYANPGLLNYGIHGVEVLYSLMGPGCQQVWAARTDGADHVTGLWDGGRLGTVRAIRSGSAGYGLTVYTEKQTVTTSIDASNNYRNLLREIMKMLETGDSAAGNRRDHRDHPRSSKLRIGPVRTVARPQGWRQHHNLLVVNMSLFLLLLPTGLPGEPLHGLAATRNSGATSLREIECLDTRSSSFSSSGDFRTSSVGGVESLRH